MLTKIKPILVVVAVAILFITVFVNNDKPTDTKGDNKPVIVTTINPLKLITQELVGDEALVSSILPLGVSPHSFEPTPKNISNLTDSALLIAVGHNLDDSFYASLETKNKLVLADILDFKKYDDEDQHHDDEHHHEGYDPHIWLSPSKALEIASAIKANIQKSIPSINEEVLEKNLNSFEEKIKRSFTPNSLNKKIIVFHDGWNYFADYFNLDIVFTFEPFPGKLPTPSHIIEIKDVIDAHSLTEIYIEPELGQEAANSLADELGISVKILKPLGDNSTSSYFDLIRYNYDTIKNEGFQ